MKNSINSGMPDFPGQPKRFYMPGLARFLTRVREVEWLGGEHPYGYAFDNPISYVDPTGMAPLLQPLPTMMCQDNPLDAPFTKAMCRALCFELADANKDGKIGPIERKRIYDPCLVACKRLGAKGERRLWCKGIESTIDHLLRHPKEGYMNIKNKQLLESLLALWNAMGCPGSPPEID